MRARTIARTVILAATLALGVSCKTPLVEGARIAKTNHGSALGSRLYTTKVISGGLDSSCHILFQKHADPIIKKTSKEIVHSQVLIYNILSDLIRNHGIRAVFLEGVQSSEDVRKSINTACDKKCISGFQTMFESCVNNTSHLASERPKARGQQVSYLFSGNAAKDFCLAKILWQDYRLADFHKLLLILHNQHVLFTGIESDRRKLSQGLKQRRLLWGLRNTVGAMLGPGGENTFKMFLRSELRAWRRPTDKNAIKEVISCSPQDTALIIGVDHKEHIEEAIKAIPFNGRPTFYLIMPECQDTPAFSISPQTIDITAKASP